MVQERAREPQKQKSELHRNLQLVRPKVTQNTVLDLAEGLRVYTGMLRQTRELQAMADELRGRILRVMEQNDLHEFENHGLKAVRQVRHLHPRLDERKARELLMREGRLAEAQQLVLDPKKAAKILDEMRSRGKFEEQEDPFGESRDVEALIVREYGREQAE